MSKTIALALRADDAEPILRDNAERAARYGALLDHVTRKTENAPGRRYNGDENYDAIRREWQEAFSRAKRIVESFGVEIEPIGEAEALTVRYPDIVLKSHLSKIGGMTFRHIDESRPDYKKPIPWWRGECAGEACKHAADRAVRRWSSSIGERKAA